MPHFYLPAEAVFYLRVFMLAASVASVAVAWDRWYIRHLLKKEYKRQLRLEVYFGRKI